MITAIIVSICYLCYYIGVILMKLVVWSAYILGSIIFFILKYAIKAIDYCVRLLPIIGSLLFTKAYLAYQKTRARNEKSYFYKEKT